MEAKNMTGAAILVIDDHEMQSKLASYLLEEAGHQVRTAGSAEGALEVLRGFAPSLILMDVQLPGMDGLELTRVLRRDPAYEETAIVALTAYTEPSDLESARAAGCNGTIVKPIDTATFTRQVGRYLSGSEAADADVRCDSHDLLAEMRNTFLTEGLQQCGGMLRDLDAEDGGGGGRQSIERVLHRWAGLGGTLGFPGISEEARRMEALLTEMDGDKEVMRRAIEIAKRRFMAAARATPKLPLALITGLRDVRIGLVDFPEEEANRIRKAARRAEVQVVLEQVTSESMEEQSEFAALIVNQCGLTAQAALQRPQFLVPAVVIGSRSSLPALTKLPPRAFDFLIAPWDAEEVLIRVYRLIARSSLPWEGDAEEATRPRVLVVDDDPATVAIVSDALWQFEMKCDIARSGKQALDAVQRRLPDAIVLDVNMLDLNGFEVLQRLRRNVVTREIPVLLLTARRQEDDIIQGYGFGANDYVVKPFKPLALVKRVDKLIAARRAAARSRLEAMGMATTEHA
jgi:CheY-like chemotaxis protein